MTNLAQYSLYLAMMLGSTTAIAQQQDSDSSGPARPRDLPPEIEQESLEVIKETVQPLSPEEIEFLRKGLNESQQATRNRYPNAKTVVTTEPLSMKPGSEIPTLYAGVNYNTNITFNDAAGNPWPVKSDSVGSQDAYTLNKITDHIFQLVVNQPNSFSNISILLDGTDSILTINVRPPEDVIDASKTYVVEGELSPRTAQEVRRQAESNPGPSLPVNRDLNQFLDGTIPEEANPIPVQSGPQIEVWAYKSQVIVKTQMKLTLPATDSEPLYGSNGWRVYAISRPSSTMSFIRNGEPVIVSVAENAIAHLKKEGQR